MRRNRARMLKRSRWTSRGTRITSTAPRSRSRCAPDGKKRHRIGRAATTAISRQGGIQSFVHELALRLDPGDLTVYAPKWDGAAEFDTSQPFEVVRHPTSLMIGGPSVTRRAAGLARSRKAEVVIFGAAAPLGLITPALRRAGVQKASAITHGHEAGWAAPPGARSLLRRIGERTDVVTYLGEYFRVRLAQALSPAAAARMTQLHPGVDAAAFTPDRAAREAIRDRHRLADRPVVVCVSRLVRRKGQDP